MQLKRIVQFFVILTIISLVTKADLSARDISGKLAAGEGSSFIPVQGSAFSIIRDVTSGIYGGNFNILIKSGGRVIYKENDQIDDLYLVFNERVDDGDVIKLDVVKGIFIFKMSQMETLPDVIVDAIKQQAPDEYKQLEPLHKKRKKRKPAKKKVIKKPVEKISLQVSSPATSYDSRIIRRHMKPEEYKREKETPLDESVLGKKVSAPTFIKPAVSQADLGQFSASMDSLNKENSNITKPAAAKSDLGNLSSSIDKVNKNISTLGKTQNRELDSSVTKSDIESIASESKITAPKTSTSSLDSIPLAKTFPLEQVSAPVGMKNRLPKSDKNMESFSTAVPPAIGAVQTGSFQNQISTTPEERPNFQAAKPEVVVKNIKLEDKITQPIVKELVKPAPIVVSVPKTEPEIIAPEPVEVKPEPKQVIKPYVDRSAPKDKIVITKTLATQKKSKPAIKDEPRVIRRHVKPEDYKREHEQIPQRMSDRVVGNGFGVASHGKIKVKAYSNNRPVSAWVEVFKADTKQRVKTFYTGKGHGLKDIKLPAGVYVIKATYRTASSKRKKTIGRVTLEEGGSINKSISFDDGSVKIKVTKHGKPIYAKVEVFKSGNKRRITYEFTSKSSGSAKFSLGSGMYDIVVKDHNNIRRFESITVRGGKSRTLNADF